MLKKSVGIPLLLIICLIPIILWLPSVSFTNPGNIFRTFGQISGIVGIILLSLQFIFSARLKFLDPFFDGLNRIYIIHHLTGSIALVLLLLHPVTLSLGYLTFSISSAVHLLIPTANNLPVLFGITGLSVMIVLLIITFFIPLKYQVWKFTHQYLGISLLLATLHIFLIPSTVSFNQPLRIYILGFCTLGILAYLYRTVFGKLLVSRLPFQIDRINSLNSNVLEIILSPLKNSLRHLPGQFIFLSVTSLGIATETHPFSIASPPGSEHLILVVKSLGDYTETLKLLKSGSVAKIEGPFGQFTYSNSYHQKQIWIAGGIGITPFVSMAKSLTPDIPYSAHLFYVVPDITVEVYASDLGKIAVKLPDKLRFNLYSSKNSGWLTAKTVTQSVPDYLTRDIFICGPASMMASLREQFNKLGVKNRFIHTEEFSLT